MYNQTRLEWHLGDRGESLNPTDFCAVLSDDKRTFDSPQSLVVALAKSQDRRKICRVFAFGGDRQGALANGLHGLNPRNTAHRYTPVQNVTNVGLATGKSQVHGGTRPVDKVNKLVTRTWGLFVTDNESGVGRIPLYPPLVELWRKQK
jgi:hypothetical protein